jgi:hypothetical protein
MQEMEMKTESREQALTRTDLQSLYERCSGPDSPERAQAREQLRCLVVGATGRQVSLGKALGWVTGRLQSMSDEEMGALPTSGGETERLR